MATQAADLRTNGRAEPSERRTHTETKAGSKTSEFYVMLAFVVAVLITTYVDNDSLNAENGWLYAGIAVAAYVVSRGLAKLGVREPYSEHNDA